MTFKKLILNGGGVLGISYIGAMRIVEENQELKEIDEFVGVSAGSICCLGLILGYSSDEMKGIIENLELINEKDISILSLFENFGINNGNSIRKTIETIIMKKGYKSSITLSELYKSTGKNFIIVVTNLSKFRAEYLNHETEPELKVIDAIRMSISIPLYFQSVEYKEDYYVDGALSDNFALEPINSQGKSLFYKSTKPSECLVLKILTNPELNETYRRDRIKKIDDFQSYMCSIFKMTINMSDSIRFKNHEQIIGEKEHIVFIETTETVDAVEFELSKENKNKLYKIGYNTMRSSYLKT
jgi:predicted acylesterase/phospholipase RssA